MAKTTVKKAAVAEPTVAAKPQVMSPVKTDVEAPSERGQVYRIGESTSEADIIRMDSMAATTLEWDYVHFRKLPDSFIATLKPVNQKAYWLAFAEWDDRVTRSNRALHEVGVDPMTKILDRPRGRNNPLVRDGDKVQELLGKGWYVTWRVQGGEGDLTGALEAGFKIIRRPEKGEEKNDPFTWTGEVWKIRDGTSDPSSGEEIYNVMVAIRRQVWDDNLKAMSMASHNAYRSNKQQFFEGAENISRDMLGGKEKVIVSDLDETHVEEHYDHGKRVS
jgi:hypothetical protein